MKKIVKITFIPIFIVLTISCGSRSSKENNEKEIEQKEATTGQTIPIIDLKKIMGKSMKEIETILGKAESVEKSEPIGTPCKDSPCDKAYFQSNKFEILFINGKADWITINNVSDYNFNKDNIELLGLAKSELTFSNPSSVNRWEELEGIKEISFFNNGSDKIDYIYIKVATK